MINTISDKLNTLIANSGLDQAKKDKLAALLPGLGKNASRFLVMWLSKKTGQDVAYETLVNFAKAFEELKGGKGEPVVKFLETAASNPDLSFGQDVIPFVLDLRQAVRSRQATAGKLVTDALDKFESRLLRFLPQEELAEIARSNLLYFVRNLNLFMELKRAYWLVELGDDGSWAKALLFALENNEESLGISKIFIEDKVYDSQVRYWIKDYLVFFPRSVQDRGAFEQVQYLKQSPNVKKLNEDEKRDLFEILKIYTWLFSPAVTEEELDRYERELSAQAAKLPKPAVPLAEPIKSLEPVAAEKKQGSEVHRPGLGWTNIQPPVPALKASESAAALHDLDQIKKDTDQKKQAQEMIDMKLQELSHRSGGPRSGG